MSDEVPTADEWLSVAEAAERSGYHREHVRELLRTKRVRGRKFAGVIWQIDGNSLADYVAAQQQRGEKTGRKPGD